MTVPKVYLIMERCTINNKTSVSEVYSDKEKAEKRLQEIEQDITRTKKNTGCECFYQYYIKEEPYADDFKGIEFNTIDKKIVDKEDYDELKLKAAWYEDIRNVIEDTIKELYPHISWWKYTGTQEQVLEEMITTLAEETKENRKSMWTQLKRLLDVGEMI